MKSMKLAMGRKSRTQILLEESLLQKTAPRVVIGPPFRVLFRVPLAIDKQLEKQMKRMLLHLATLVWCSVYTAQTRKTLSKKKRIPDESERHR